MSTGLSNADLEKKKTNAINILLGKSQPGGDHASNSNSVCLSCFGVKPDRPVVSTNVLKELKGLKEKMSDVVVAMSKVIDLLDSNGSGTCENYTATVDVGTTTAASQEITCIDAETMTKNFTCDRATSYTEPWEPNELSERPEHHRPGTVGCRSPVSIGPTMTPISCRTPKSSGARRRRSVVGTGRRTSDISAWCDVRELFVSNLHPTTSTNDMVNYVKRRATIEHVSQISHPDAISKSFLFIVPGYELDNILCPSFWPSGVRCREFIRPAGGRLA